MTVRWITLPSIFLCNIRSSREFCNINYIPDRRAGADRPFPNNKLSATVVWQDGNSLYIGPNLPAQPAPERRICGNHQPQ